MKPLLGKWADHEGYKPLLVVGMVLYAVAFGMFAGVSGVGGIYTARIIQGVAAALLGLSTYGIATGAAKGDDIAQQLGGITSATTVGIFVGSMICFIVLGRVSFMTGWKILFILFAIAAMIGSIIVIINVPKTSKMINTSVRVNGQKQERKKLSVDVIKLLGITFIVSLASSMLGPMLMIYLQDHFTNDLGLLALTFIPSTIIYGVLPVRIGRISDKYGSVRGMVIGLLISGGVLLMMPLISSLIILGMMWCIDAVGELLATPSEKAFFYELVGVDGLGQRYGIYSAVGGMGAVLGPLIGGMVYEKLSPSLTFYLGGMGLCLAGALAWVSFRKYEGVNEKIGITREL